MKNSLNSVTTCLKVVDTPRSGKAATFSVGDHYPITLSLLSSGLGSASNSGSSSSTISTEQFTVGAGPVAMVSQSPNTGGQYEMFAHCAVRMRVNDLFAKTNSPFA
jgi:hypothetical protein